MDPALSLIMSNMARWCHGNLLLDPFVGTGSLLVSAALHGAIVMGTDIDFKLLHGRGAYEDTNCYVKMRLTCDNRRI